MSFNDFEKCMSKEEILAIVFANNDYERAAKRFLDLGFVDEAERFFLLEKQGKNIEILEQLTSIFGQSTQKIFMSAGLYQETINSLGGKINLVGEIATILEESSKRFANSSSTMYEVSQTISNAANRMNSRY